MSTSYRHQAQPLVARTGTRNGVSLIVEDALSWMQHHQDEWIDLPCCLDSERPGGDCSCASPAHSVLNSMRRYWSQGQGAQDDSDPAWSHIRIAAGWSHDSEDAALTELRSYMESGEMVPLSEPKVRTSQDDLGTLYLAECEASCLH